MNASRELDALVAEHVMEWEGGVTQPLPNYSTDISPAWAVHKLMCGKLFSVRRRYLDGLTDLIRENVGSQVNGLVAWPDLIIWLTPTIICESALQAVGAEQGVPS